MKNDLHFGPFERTDRTSDSEAFVYHRGNIVASIKGDCRNEGSFLQPRYVITSYIVEVGEDGEIEQTATFKTRGEATRFVRKWWGPARPMRHDN